MIPVLLQPCVPLELLISPLLQTHHTHLYFNTSHARVTVSANNPQEVNKSSWRGRPSFAPVFELDPLPACMYVCVSACVQRHVSVCMHVHMYVCALIHEKTGVTCITITGIPHPPLDTTNMSYQTVEGMNEEDQKDSLLFDANLRGREIEKQDLCGINLLLKQQFSQTTKLAHMYLFVQHSMRDSCEKRRKFLWTSSKRLQRR